jgi:hypothetical protein
MKFYENRKPPPPNLNSILWQNFLWYHLSIFLSNFQILLLMTIHSRWCQILKVKVTFDGVLPLFVLGFLHKNLTLAMILSFLNIFSSNFQIILLMTTHSRWLQILKIKVTFDGVIPLFVLGFLHKNFQIMLLMTTRSWWHAKFFDGVMPLFLLEFYSDIAPEGDTSVQLNTHLVLNEKV